MGHSVTFVAGLSFLHSIPDKGSRPIFLSFCSSWYLVGIASGISVIANSYYKNLQISSISEVKKQPPEGLYIHFAILYLILSIFLLCLLVGTKILSFIGTIDYHTSMCDEVRIANSNGSIFDSRKDIIKRIKFFYVIKSKQWTISALFLFIDGIHNSVFIFYIFWFALNSAVHLTDIATIDQILWVVTFGSMCSSIAFHYFSVKVNFVFFKVCQIFIALVCLMTKYSFWMLLLLSGLTYSSLQICIVETSHFLFTEVLISLSYAINLATTIIVYYFFVLNANDSYFYSIDKSTLVAQVFVFSIITALTAVIVGLLAPRTYKTTLFDIQYDLLGIIFKKHQIEQLNMRCLNDGTIPTISRSI